MNRSTLANPSHLPRATEGHQARGHHSSRTPGPQKGSLRSWTSQLTSRRSLLTSPAPFPFSQPRRALLPVPTAKQPSRGRVPLQPFTLRPSQSFPPRPQAAGWNANRPRESHSVPYVPSVGSNRRTVLSGTHAGMVKAAPLCPPQELPLLPPQHGKGHGLPPSFDFPSQASKEDSKEHLTAGTRPQPWGRKLLGRWTWHRETEKEEEAWRKRRKQGMELWLLPFLCCGKSVKSFYLDSTFLGDPHLPCRTAESKRLTPGCQWL